MFVGLQVSDIVILVLITEDGSEMLTYYPRDLESLIIDQ